MAGFFPVFFKSYWSSGVDATQSTLYLGVANSSGSLILALIAPLLGSLADRGGYKKEILFITTMFGILGSIGLFFVPAGAWHIAVLIYFLAAFGFTASMIPYDSLLIDVSGKDHLDKVSGLGYALGYLGGGVLFLINVLMTLYPNSFGIPDQITAVRLSFLTVGLWWFVFSIPLFTYVKEYKQVETPLSPKFFVECWSGVMATFKELLKDRALFVFLLAYFFYIEGVNTTIKMAVDYGLALGFDSSSLIKALLLVQFVAFPFAIFFGWFGEKFGALRGIYVCISVYIGMSVFAYSITDVSQFYMMAIAIGLVQGGIQSLSRSYFAAQVPAEKSAQYFGFFNMLGKFSSVLGPLLVGVAVAASGSSRSTSLVLFGFFAAGVILLWQSRRLRV